MCLFFIFNVPHRNIKLPDNINIKNENKAQIFHYLLVPSLVHLLSIVI